MMADDEKTKSLQDETKDRSDKFILKKISIFLVSRPCHAGNTSSHSNTEVKQHWETAWLQVVLLTKTKAELRFGSM